MKSERKAAINAKQTVFRKEKGLVTGKAEDQPEIHENESYGMKKTAATGGTPGS